MHPRIAPSFPSVGRGPHDAVDWLVADRSGRVLARNISFSQLRARYEHGLLSATTLVARVDDRLWRPVGHVMDAASGARKLAPPPAPSGPEWYVTKPGRQVVGPVGTELLRRGISEQRVPADSLVCEAGRAEWEPLAEVAVFADALNEVQFDSEATAMFEPLRWSFEEDY